MKSYTTQLKTHSLSQNSSTSQVICLDLGTSQRSCIPDRERDRERPSSILPTAREVITLVFSPK